MGVAAYNRGTQSILRPLREAAEHDRWVENSLRTFVAAEKSVEYCRNVNSLLAEIHGHKGIRLAFAQANLNSHVGQRRRDKYLAACAIWRGAKPGRSEWFAALNMGEAAKNLMEWLGVTL